MEITDICLLVLELCVDMHHKNTRHTAYNKCVSFQDCGGCVWRRLQGFCVGLGQSHSNGENIPYNAPLNQAQQEDGRRRAVGG